jgi:DNA-binding winged helix-turn-helix (wHTH) protein
VRFGEFVLDEDQRRVMRGEGELHLTPKAFDLLVLLIDEAPRVVRKADLHQRLWPGTFVPDATLVGLVKELRRVLDDQEPKPLIRTAHRVGYAFDGPLERVSAGSPPVSRWVVAGSRRIPLQPGENLIGRDPASGICLDATGVSRRHARIVVASNFAKLEDLNSKNGTMVGDEVAIGPIVLHDGDRIHIGPVVIIYHASASGISTETQSRPRRRAETVS